MWIQLAVALAMMVVSYIITPKPKTPHAEVQEGEVPTASASDPIPVVFGECDVKSNVVWWGDPSTKPIRTKGGKK